MLSKSCSVDSNVDPWIKKLKSKMFYEEYFHSPCTKKKQSNKFRITFYMKTLRPANYMYKRKCHQKELQSTWHAIGDSFLSSVLRALSLVTQNIWFSKPLILHARIAKSKWPQHIKRHTLPTWPHVTKIRCYLTFQKVFPLR